MPPNADINVFAYSDGLLKIRYNPSPKSNFYQALRALSVSWVGKMSE